MSNRIIKFRVWDNINKRMLGIFGPFGHHDEYNLLYLEGYLDVPVEDNLNFMQFTGLKDKNGKDVFEGDIFQCSSGEDKKKCVHEMIWREARPFRNMGGWQGKDLNDGYDWIGDEEIIGNIYENPELLPT